METDKTLGVTPVDAAVSFEALLGRRLGDRYVLRRVLGSGGMGAVYEAHDERLVREVAVKVVRPAIATDATAIARFVREARAAAGLAHPAIITVFDAGLVGELPFLVMERLVGVSLADRLATTGLGADAAVRIAARLLEALDVAHRAGIVHRDIKPANVFLCAPDDAPKLLDFGVAAVSQAQGDLALTTENALVGTPLYVAPEHFRGAAPSPRDDVYAVGAVLFEALARRPIYLARALGELFAQKMTEDPAPLATLAPSVPAAVAAAVDRALSRDPMARFASAAEMRDALLAALGDARSIPSTRVSADAIAATEYATPRPGMPRPGTPEPGTPQPGTPEPGTPRPSAAQPVSASATPAPVTRTATDGERARPRRWPWLVGIAAVLALGLAGALASGRFDSAPRRPAVSDAATTAPVAPPELGLRLLAELHDASGSRRAALTSVDTWTAARDDLHRAIGANGDATPLRWRAAERVADARVKLLSGDLDGAARSASEATQLEPSWSVAHLTVADVRLRAGDADGALTSARRAQQLEPAWWLPESVIGTTHAVQGRFAEAIAAYRRGLALAPREPALLDALALALAASGNELEAARFAAEAIAADPDAPWSHVVLAEAALEARDFTKAYEEASRAASVAPLAASPELARADALAGLGREADARAAYQHALELAEGNRQTGLPHERVEEVRAALAADRLPAERFATDAVDGHTRAARPRTVSPRTVARPSGGGGGRTVAHDDPLNGLDGL